MWNKALWVVESVKFQVCQKKKFALLQVSSEISSLCNKKFASDKSFFLSSLHEASKISCTTFNLSRTMFIVAFVQNVFFWNGVLESRGEVWWCQLFPLEVQNAHDAF